MFQTSIFPPAVLLITLSFSLIHASPAPAAIHPSPTTIPAFPEQSALSSACPLHLPPPLSPALPSACSHPLRRSRCCPSLAAWIYSAYSPSTLSANVSSNYDLPVPPDDSETCVGSLDREMEERGVKLVGPNATCDLVYCYCGIRLRPLRCPGKVEEGVGRLERECGGRGVSGCNRCLHSLYQLTESKLGKTNKTEKRVNEMQNKDCELMGLSWLLAKNKSAYIHTVTFVLRALMMNTDGHDGPRSCTLDSDGLPMAVDSSEINGQTSPIPLPSEFFLWVVSLCFLYFNYL